MLSRMITLPVLRSNFVAIRTTCFSSRCFAVSKDGVKEAVRRRLLPERRFRIVMTEEERAAKLKAIQTAQQEVIPPGLFAKFKFYFKRYWYIAIPVYSATCIAWFGGIFLVVKSGVDVVKFLEFLHMPDSIVEKVKNIPETAGKIVIALLLYKLATPLRYATGLLGIRLAFVVLRKMGLLKTAREVEYHMRTRYADLNKRRIYAATQSNAKLKNIKKGKSNSM
ncbi:unnamed protein product [Bursaphelenchus xylophilus]|uniref:(pine wood nematode) hypothetical protein n=1 Tax=Bursaphelenchus xylophilus TaxID=6326 RepID=A0A1I7S3C5_BURXY|nr:unnamed protein product [Bursaphelenchus xylophilus]CAG9116212.1 unnamed protein product [Bursaphelenchus xylophilus]